MTRGLVVPQDKEDGKTMVVGQWEKGGKLKQRPDRERRHMPAKKSARQGRTSALTRVFLTYPDPTKRQKNRCSPQHIPELSVVISTSPTLLEKYNFLLIGLQGPGQKSPFHSCFFWSHFYAELDSLSSVFFQHLMQYLFQGLPCSSASSSVTGTQ